MSTVQRNLAANLIGTGWNSVLSLIFIPVYLRLLGVEAYGLIGFYTVLLTLFTLFDFGLSSTLNRSIARLSALPDSKRDQGNLLRTFETIYISVAVGGAALLFTCAPLVAKHWVHVHQLPVAEVIAAIRMMAVLTAFQFPLSLYQSGLLGLQRHVVINAIGIVCSTLRAGGVVLVLLFVSRTVTAFFAWQVIVMAAQTLSLAIAIWRLVGGTARARFSREILRAERRFAASVGANAVILLLLMQTDKAIVSAMTPLQDLGYYSLAATLAGGLWSIVVPINMAFYPRFSQLMAVHGDASLIDVFHKSCQAVAVFVLPIAVTLVAFARPVLLLWTGNSVAAEHAAWIVPLLVSGTAMYALTSMPAYVQLAAGWPGLVLYTNIVSAILFVPMAIAAVRIFGAPGAALLWLGVNTAYLVPAWIMFRRVLTHERRRWLMRDVAIPALAAVLVSVAGRLAFPSGMNRLASALYIAAVAAAAFWVVLLLTPDVRRVVASRLRSFGGPRTAMDAMS